MDKTEALEELRKLLPPGTTVWTNLRYVSRSGMGRAIAAYILTEDGPRQLDWLIEQAGVFRRHRNYDGLSIGGCGMDMGFHLVYTLSRALYPDGYKCNGNDGSSQNRKVRARRCRSNDHSNDQTKNYRRGRRHHDGGYALNQEWL